MKKTTYTTTRFDVGYDGFYVEVSPYYRGEEKWFEFVLCQENYGMKSFMFGLKAEDCPEEEWEDMIQRNLYCENYIGSFYEEMDMLETAFEEKYFSNNETIQN